MTKLLFGAAMILALSACDGANDNPTNARPPADVGTPAAPPAGGQCTQEARICNDGSLAAVTPGTCAQKCPGE